MYLSALTANSTSYCRQSPCVGSMYYYQAIRINVSKNGYYSIVCNSSMNTYGYLYNYNFNPAYPYQDLTLLDDQNAGNNQFKLTYFLQSSVTYIVVATTYSANVTGAFSISVIGTGSVSLVGE